MKDCAYFETLLALLPDGELTDTERRALDEHLASCPACRALREELAAWEDPALWEEPLPDGLHDAILAAVETTPQAAPTPKKKPAARRWIGIAAMLAVVILAGSIGLSHMRMGGSSAPLSAAGGSSRDDALIEAPAEMEAAGGDAAYDTYNYTYDSGAAADADVPEESTAMTEAAPAPEPEESEDLWRDTAAKKDLPRTREAMEERYAGVSPAS